MDRDKSFGRFVFLLSLLLSGSGSPSGRGVRDDDDGGQVRRQAVTTAMTTTDAGDDDSAAL